MSLSGTLEVFPLEEVLRLVARSHQNGCLRVTNEQEGRIYIESGSLSYATVEPDELLRSRLVASGLGSEDALSRIDVTRGTLAEALNPAVSPAALTELIREQSIEALYRIRRPGRGKFEFAVEARPRYATGQSFDIETIISEAERRAAEWADIENVVPDLSAPWRMVPELDEDSVNLSDTAWRFLAAMDGSCAVEPLADRLGITRFQTARRMAELARARLVEPVPARQAATVGYSSFGTLGEPHDEAPVEPVTEPAPAEQSSWWEDAPVTADAAAGATAAGEETSEGSPRDESFLETVFGELEKTEDEADDDSPTDGDDDSGFGLLRRRGLGAAFRELADS